MARLFSGCQAELIRKNCAQARIWPSRWNICSGNSAAMSPAAATTLLSQTPRRAGIPKSSHCLLSLELATFWVNLRRERGNTHGFLFTLRVLYGFPLSCERNATMVQRHRRSVFHSCSSSRVTSFRFLFVCVLLICRVGSADFRGARARLGGRATNPLGCGFSPRFGGRIEPLRRLVHRTNANRESLCFGARTH